MTDVTSSLSTLLPRRTVSLLFFLMAWSTTLSASLADEREGEAGLESAMKRGDYTLAKQLSLRHDDAPSMMVRARLAEFEGKLDDALRFAALALKRSNTPELRQQALSRLAQLEAATGDIETAEQRLRDALPHHPDDVEIRFWLGKILADRGALAEAKPVLDEASRLFNAGKLQTSRELTYLGRSMHVIGAFDDANYAFERAHEVDPNDADALVFWGELFLEKYNFQDAAKNFDEALEINVSHPRALAGKALVHMLATNQSDDVREILDEVERVAPALPELLLVHAHVSIRDGNCPDAMTHVDKLLKARPAYSEALALKASCAYLSDDTERYRQIKEKILSIHPTNADALATVGDYGVMAHRYVEAMEVYREALRLDADNSRALLGLGIGLSRIRKEDEALAYLQRAFDVDPYNVRAYNMLELYEKTMPSYSFKEHEGFFLRAHNEQFELIDLYVTPVIKEAMRVMSDKYGFAPAPDLAVEVFPDPTTFAVRSLGMPHVSPQGICFGHVVTVRSPSDGNFNWRQVVWHELAHVYHLQLSNSRVPRWFTEGLAEYETNIQERGWQRHHDREIASRVWASELPTVLELDHGFTHARTMLEVVQAYHLASLAIHYIAETHGFDAIVSMLKGWAEKGDTEVVLREVLEVTPSQFDQGFEMWLKRRLIGFKVQLETPRVSEGDADAIARRMKLNARDARAKSEMALVRLSRDDIEQARALIDEALAIRTDDPSIFFAAMMIEFKDGQLGEAKKHGERILDLFSDSYELRLFLAHLSTSTEDIKSAKVHLMAATSLYAKGGDAWMKLAALAKNTGDNALYEHATKKLFWLNQHEPSIARENIELALSTEDASHLDVSLQRWLDVDPFDPRAQRKAIEIATLRRDAEALGLAWRSLILLKPGERPALYREALASLGAIGAKEQISRLRDDAAQRGVDLSM